MTIQIITRKEAKAQGLKTYFTGNPCKRGHNSQRYTSSRGCVECLRIRDKETRTQRKAYFDSRREQKSEYDKQYRADNREKIILRNREHYQENKEEVSERGREYRNGHKREEILERKKRYTATHKIEKKLYDVATQSNRSYKVYADGSVTQEALMIILKCQGFRCAYCLQDISLEEGKDMTIDHIIPTSKRGVHSVTNIVWSCRSCNSKKKDEIWEPHIEF